MAAGDAARVAASGFYFIANLAEPPGRKAGE
jgi:hypothetical protein